MVIYEVIKTATVGATFGYDVTVAVFSNREAASYVKESLSKRDKTGKYWVESRAVHSESSEPYLDRVVREIQEETPC